VGGGREVATASVDLGLGQLGRRSNCCARAARRDVLRSSPVPSALRGKVIGCRKVGFQEDEGSCVSADLIQHDGRREQEEG
jgi:hypothetical protein